MLRPALLALTLALTAAAHADEAAAPSAAPSLLNRLAALAGTWTGVSTGHGGEPTPVTVSYRVTSAGKAVTETFMEGTPHEMLTVFHLDGDRLVLTHYCGLGNQPHMRADEVTPEQIRFTCTGGANIHEGQTTHMHGLTFGVEGRRPPHRDLDPARRRSRPRPGGEERADAASHDAAWARGAPPALRPRARRL